jgi:L-threonylcarbamoyladenylate synthase
LIPPPERRQNVTLSIPIQKGARILRQGGVIAYPTEGVFGLGCLPGDAAAVTRVLDIKRRDPARGLILIAATPGQLASWCELPDAGGTLESSLERPVTWLVPARPTVPFAIRGAHHTVAVRITSHPVAAALCAAARSAIVSTSANIAGQNPARNAFVLRRNFGHLVDFIVPGSCGPAGSASEIRDLATGRIVRAAKP